MLDLTAHPYALHVGGELVQYCSSIRGAQQAGADASLFRPGSHLRRLSPLPWWVIDSRTGLLVAGAKPHSAVLRSAEGVGA